MSRVYAYDGMEQLAAHCAALHAVYVDANKGPCRNVHETNVPGVALAYVGPVEADGTNSGMRLSLKRSDNKTPWRIMWIGLLSPFKIRLS
ncbi:hypothetical protein Elgi_16100 [Paenibacillus elgii]|nr:hypothetical protein Elgi_16100 [Paenibacillus elgii]